MYYTYSATSRVCLLDITGDEVRKLHFKTFLTQMQVGKGDTYLNRTFLDRQNEHHYGQLHYLQDFVTNKGKTVEVLR